MSETEILLEKIISWISAISKDSKSKKDILSCIFFVEIAILTGVVIPFFVQPLNILNQYRLKLISFYQGNLPNMNLQKILFDIDLSPILKSILFITLTVGITFLFNKARKTHFILIYIGLQIIISLFIYKDVWKILLFLAVLIFITNTFRPFGSGFYFGLINYARYFFDIYRLENRKKLMLIGPTVIRVIISGFFFVLLFNWIIPVFSIYASTMLYIAIILLQWINKADDKIDVISRKIVTYSIIIPFVLLKYDFLEKEIQSIVIALVTIFFSVERVFSLLKELKEQIEKSSMLYLINEIENYELLKLDKIELLDSEMQRLSERTLIRQIVINYKLDSKEVYKLIQTYKDNEYRNETILVNIIDYCCNRSKMTLEEREKELSIFYQDNIKNYFSIREEYVTILFYLEKDYAKIVEILSDFWLGENDSIKYIFYYALKKIQNPRGAESVKREIENFINVEHKMIFTKTEIVKNQNTPDISNLM